MYVEKLFCLVLIWGNLKINTIPFQKWKIENISTTQSLTFFVVDLHLKHFMTQIHEISFETYFQVILVFAHCTHTLTNRQRSKQFAHCTSNSYSHFFFCLLPLPLFLSLSLSLSILPQNQIVLIH